MFSSVSCRGGAALAEFEDWVDLSGSAVAVLAVLADLAQCHGRHPLVLYGRGPHAELDEPGVVIAADGPQASQVAFADNLLKVGHLVCGDEVVEDGIGDQVACIFANGPRASEAPVDDDDLAARPAERVLRPEVEAPILVERWATGTWHQVRGVD